MWVEGSNLIYLRFSVSCELLQNSLETRRMCRVFGSTEHDAGHARLEEFYRGISTLDMALLASQLAVSVPTLKFVSFDIPSLPSDGRPRCWRVDREGGNSTLVALNWTAFEEVRHKEGLLCPCECPVEPGRVLRVLNSALGR